jgi:hypothetical protein
LPEPVLVTKNDMPLGEPGIIVQAARVTVAASMAVGFQSRIERLLEWSVGHCARARGSGRGERSLLEVQSRFKH